MDKVEKLEQIYGHLIELYRLGVNGDAFFALVRDVDARLDKEIGDPPEEFYIPTILGGGYNFDALKGAL